MPRQILVCDDEAHIQRAISLKLTRAGFDAKCVTDVETCWRLLQRDKIPALLIIDRTFPSGPDGADLLRWVRQDPRLAGLPVIMLLANQAELPTQLELLADLKVALIVPKPFSPRELVDAVSGLLGPLSDTVPMPHVASYLTSDCKL